MKQKKFLSFLLAFGLLLMSLGPIQVKAESDVGPKGVIDITVLFPYELKQQSGDFLVSFFYGSKELLHAVPLDKLGEQGMDITSQLMDINGNSVTQGSDLAAAVLSFGKLPLGLYRFVLSGEGYKTYETEILLENYSQHLIISNDNNTFTAGDLNQDGKVDREDLALLKEKLGSFEASYDLNRDKLLDLIDYAYLYNNIKENKSDAIQKNTTMISNAFIDTAKVCENLEKYGVSEQEAQQLFAQEEATSVVQLKTPNGAVISKENPIELEVPISSTCEEIPELQYVVMTVPNDGTEPANGEVVFEDEEGNLHSEKFDTVSELQLFAKSANQTIIIDLGRRIPVKRVIIKITGTTENTKLASIAKVEFLQEMISTPQEERNRVKNVTAKSMDGAVSLSWSNLANVTEYIVSYGIVPGEYTSIYPSVSNSCMIGGLENGIEYYFTVHAKNGDWEGLPSKEVACTPEEQAAPGRVGGVRVEPKNQALKITWGGEKTASYYKLFYKEKDAKQYTVISNITETNYYLAGLTNGVEYWIMVSAVNDYGEGAKSPEVAGTPLEIIVKEPEGIPTYNLIDSSHITNIRLSHPDHYDKTYYPNGIDPWELVDGDYTTTWIARSNWWENQGFVVTFDKAYEMDHVVWVTRLDEERFKNTINRYYVEVWGENDDLTKGGTVLVPMGTSLARNPLSSEGVEILTFPKSSVKQIRVSTKMKDGGPALPSASEIRFHEYYSLVDDIEALFNDVLHTTIADGTTEQKIASYQERLNGNTGEFYVNKNVLARELEIAQSLLPGQTPKKNIVEAETGRNAGKDTNRNFAFTLNDLQPLGIAAKEKEDIIVYAQPDAAGVLPSLVATQYAGEAGGWSQTFALKEGRNIITIPSLTDMVGEKGGSLYLKYYGEGGAKINIFGGTKIPLLNLPDFSFETLTFTGTEFTDPKQAQNKAAVKAYVEELTEYSKTLTQSNLQKAVLNSTEIATKNVLLSLPAKAVESALGSGTLEEKTEVLYKTLAAWEKNMYVHYAVCGLSADAPETRDQYPSSRINIRYMTLTGKAFMYAGGAHIGIGYGSSGGMVNAPMSQNGLFGWGINHEIGHVLDQNGLVIAETTNNIHSLFSQTFNGGDNLGTARLEGGIYDKVLTKTAYGAPGASNNVFVQLAMYWQLHLAYDDIGEASYDFYGRLYKTLREGTITAENSDMLFVKLACHTANKNLYEFFKHWGYEITPETLAYISQFEEEQRPIYYGTDSVKRYLSKGGSSIFNGEYLGVTAQQDNSTIGGTVELTISLPAGIDSSKLIGYEIRRNGVVLAFIRASATGTDTVYRDENITINNAVLTYEVVAYDLAYGTISGTSEPMKLSYDGKLDNSQFEFILNGSTLTLQSTNINDIAGISFYTDADSNILVGGTMSAQTFAETASGDALIMPRTQTVSGDALRATVQIDGKEEEVLLTKAFEKDGFSTYYFTSTSDPEDGSIQIYTTNKLTVTLGQIGYTTEELKSKFYAVSYPGDTIEFYNPQEQAFFGTLAEDYIYDGGQINKGSTIVVGTYRGNPIYNVIKLKAKYSSNVEGEDDDSLEDRILEGEQLLFAIVPENKIVTEISNGIWVYILPESIKEEKLPDTIYAEFYRVDNPDTLEGERLVSNTIPLPVPSLDTLPDIYLTNNLNGETN